MLKIEKKLIDFLEKHMLLLAVLLITVIALLMRRQNIWYYTSDYIYYFDMHNKNVQSVFYYLFVVLTGYFAEIPLHGVKWMAGIADFAVACMCVFLCKKEIAGEGKLTEKAKWKCVLLYAGCLFAPVVYLRGCVWAQVESMAMAFLLLALYFVKYRENTIAACIAAGVGVALYPFYLVLVVGYILCTGKGKNSKILYRCLGVAAVAFLLNIVACLVVDVSWKQGIPSLFRWTSYHPYTGELYSSAADWLRQMLILGGYGAALLSGLAAFRRKIPYYAAVIIQVLAAVCYGAALGW